MNHATREDCYVTSPFDAPLALVVFQPTAAATLLELRHFLSRVSMRCMHCRPWYFLPIPSVCPSFRLSLQCRYGI